MGRGICTVCQRFFDKQHAAQVKCKECDEKDEVLYAKIRDYLESHQGATVSEVMVNTGVPLKTLDRFINERRVYIMNNKLQSDE